jgi:hypothetical protein
VQTARILGMQPSQPVAPFAAKTAMVPSAPRELEAHELDPEVLADLVRARLTLERGRGWILLSGVVSTVAAVVGLGLGVTSRPLLAVLAPLVASVPFVAGIFAERICWLSFARLARRQGLSERACRRVFDGAAAADHWIYVLSTCGRPPSDDEIARFVASH